MGWNKVIVKPATWIYGINVQNTTSTGANSNNEINDKKKKHTVI